MRCCIFGLLHIHTYPLIVQMADQILFQLTYFKSLGEICEFIGLNLALFLWGMSISCVFIFILDAKVFITCAGEVTTPLALIGTVVVVY